MELNEYQGFAARTGNDDLPWREQRINYALGLAGEAGELANVVKKWAYHGHDEAEARQKVKDEAGDVLWYLAELLNVFNLSLNEAATYNVEKLRKRYPDGFSQQASLFRAENP